MTDFSQINPYEAMYRNMHIAITSDITLKETQLLIRQLGYIHNLTGVVLKDFTKLLVLKCFTQPQKKIQERRKSNLTNEIVKNIPTFEINKSPQLLSDQFLEFQYKSNERTERPYYNQNTLFEKNNLPQQIPNEANNNVQQMISIEKMLQQEKKSLYKTSQAHKNMSQIRKQQRQISENEMKEIYEISDDDQK